MGPAIGVTILNHRTVLFTLVGNPEVGEIHLDLLTEGQAATMIAQQLYPFQ